MQFRFDANQEYQLQAISAVVDLFEGQPRVEKDLTFVLGADSAAVPNRLELDETALLKNLHVVQARGGLTPDKRLETIEETITIAADKKQACFPNFSVEMETGTGKTYVYIRTALDLHRRNGPRSGRGQGSHNRYQPAARAVLTFTTRPICWQAMATQKKNARKQKDRQRTLRVTDPNKQQSFYICLDDKVRLADLKPLNLARNTLFVCRDVALDDETAANLALQCRLRTI